MRTAPLAEPQDQGSKCCGKHDTAVVGGLGFRRVAGHSSQPSPPLGCVPATLLGFQDGDIFFHGVKLAVLPHHGDRLVDDGVAFRSDDGHRLIGGNDLSITVDGDHQIIDDEISVIVDGTGLDLDDLQCAVTGPSGVGPASGALPGGPVPARHPDRHQSACTEHNNNDSLPSHDAITSFPIVTGSDSHHQ